MKPIRETIQSADDYDLLVWRKRLMEEGISEVEERMLYAYITDELEDRGLLVYDEITETYVAA